ncbi:hypothetical protein [Gynuella sp.]|uniref:hypothetical protein n=1 Tax=Gynuella sp. TaxID=2969146 RepID=UPI003D0B0C2E
MSGDAQTEFDITGTTFPKMKNSISGSEERFWFIKDEFVAASELLLIEGRMFSSIGAMRSGERWVVSGTEVTKYQISAFMGLLRQFYMRQECLSIYSFSNYLAANIENKCVKMFFEFMANSWEESLKHKVYLYDTYEGSIETSKQLVDTVLYSGLFHSQEKYKKKYLKLLESIDESLILMHAYNSLHCSFHLNQISRAIRNLSPTNMKIMLPDHLRHKWDDNCPYKVIE